MSVLPASLFENLPFALLIVGGNAGKHHVLYANTVFSQWATQPDAKNDLAEIWPDIIPHISISPCLVNDPVALGDRWVSVSLQPITWENVPALAIWAYDSTTLESRLQESEDAAKVKSNFLATMSHEMRTPLQSVFGLLELMELESPPPRIQEMVGIAKTSAAGLLDILDDILDLAKIEADKMELDQFEVPVRTLVRGVLEALGVKAQGKGLSLKDDIADNVPAVIAGDPKRLRQILINLTGNAIKFTESGSVTIRVTSPSLYSLRFEVIDTGVGIPLDVQKKLFAPFTQADSSTSRKFGGTGLGLSISLKLASLMDGKMGVSSEPGKGATFWFEIPIEILGTDISAYTLPELSGLSVLSVEDHPQGAKEIVTSLRSMGASVESCATFAEGLALVQRRPFDVGLIDQGLPDGAGLDLIREIMKIRPAMGLVMYTARDDPGLQPTLQELGATYLAKPASRIGLGQTVLDAAAKRNHAPLQGKTRLLIAEDTPSVREMLRRQLAALGADADFVENGKQALGALASDAYGILITDLHMPVMDGYALIKSLREQEKQSGERLPVIALTADVQLTQRQTYLSHGFDECLLKPVSLGHFRRLLTRWGILSDTPASFLQATSMTQPQSSGAIDRASLIEQMGEINEQTKEMLALFPDMCRPLLDRAQKAAAANDLKDLAEAAHSLKGAARSAGALRLGDVAAQIQEISEKGDTPGPLLETLHTEFSNAEKDIRSLCEEK
jgi:two-component system sensor histidine kinase/response regulator